MMTIESGSSYNLLRSSKDRINVVVVVNSRSSCSLFSRSSSKFFSAAEKFRTRCKNACLLVAFLKKFCTVQVVCGILEIMNLLLGRLLKVIFGCKGQAIDR